MDQHIWMKLAVITLAMIAYRELLFTIVLFVGYGWLIGSSLGLASLGSVYASSWFYGSSDNVDWVQAAMLYIAVPCAGLALLWPLSGLITRLKDDYGVGFAFWLDLPATFLSLCAIPIALIGAALAVGAIINWEISEIGGPASVDPLNAYLVGTAAAGLAVIAFKVLRRPEPVKPANC